MFAQSEINARRPLSGLLGGPSGPSRAMQPAVVCALLRSSPEPYACLRAKSKLVVASVTALLRVGHHG